MNSAKVVTSNCILGYVSKTDYTCIFDKNGQYNVVEDVKFLSMINILYRFSPYTLENYYHNFSKKICEYDEIIVKQNQLIEHVYIVRKGFFQVYNESEHKLHSNNLQFLDNLNKERFISNTNYELKGYLKNKYKNLVNI